jgi:hypothetical protein
MKQSTAFICQSCIGAGRTGSRRSLIAHRCAGCGLYNIGVLVPLRTPERHRARLRRALRVSIAAWLLAGCAVIVGLLTAGSLLVHNRPMSHYNFTILPESSPEKSATRSPYYVEPKPVITIDPDPLIPDLSFDPLTPSDVRAARAYLHLTQAQLAEELCVGLRTVKSWEANDRKLSAARNCTGPARKLILNLVATKAAADTEATK